MKKTLRKVHLAFLLILGFQVVNAQFKVSGSLKDDNSNDPLVGVTLIVKGTTVGTVSDVDGKFELTVPANSSILVISYIGYETLEQPISSSSPILDIKLAESNKKLSEVVISGLSSSVKRSNAANSTGHLGAEELNGITRPQTLDGAMSGKVVGANIVANSGAPGGGISVKLRGISSIAGSSEPLYVIDGVISSNAQFNTGAGTRAFNGAVTNSNAGSQDQATNRISDFNPADIESIDILKGPSAAAIYGIRANNGVIIITTKRGKAGKTQVRLSQDFGISQASNLLKSEDWTEDKINTYGGYTGQSDVPTALKEFRAWKAAGGVPIDYDKEMFGETGGLVNTNLSVSGGNEKTKFYINGGYNKEDGIVKTTGFQRLSVRANIDHVINDWVNFSVSNTFVNSQSSRSFNGNDNNGVSLGYTIAYIPNFIDIRPKTANGIITYPEWPGSGQNPFEIRDRAENKESTNRIGSAAVLNFNLLRQENSRLKLSFKAGLDYLNSQPRVYAPEDLQYQIVRATPGASRYATNISRSLYLQSYLTYDWKLADVGLTSSLGFTREQTQTDESYIQGETLLPGQRNPSSAGLIAAYSYLSKFEGVATDLNQEFNWKDKIIGRVGVRFDRSTLVTDPTKWYAFKRASIALNLTNFDFLKDNTVFSQLKPRVAFGQTGGVPGYGNLYSTLGSTNYDGKLGAFAPTVLGNKGLELETAQELEYGLDFGLFKNRILFEITHYNKQIFNFNYIYALSPSVGASSIAQYPIGDLSNKGWELGLTVNVVKSTLIDWSTTVSFWNNKTTIDRLIVPEFYAGNGFGNFGRNRVVLNASPTLWYGRDETGKAPVSFGRDAQPDFQMSWTNNIHFLKSWDFFMTWHTSQGSYVSTLTRELKDEGGTTFDWTTNIKNLDNSRLYGNPGYSTANYILDASYIRLREVALYYTIGGLDKITNGAISKIKLGVSGQNLLTFSDILKWTYDPEASNFGNASVGANVDLTPFPSTKKMFFHVLVDF